ncbi:alpha/beta fold hydrolase [Dyadobacter sp. NIV53]|uniref:alpha/beta fold hydrolase n=1 Tax=Dyadobacter sp. NIV53 TaxID=2861765 RepID=UPI001C86ACC8|nr:alpha/beta hydrolase [Dyadobacter sp. NIV53]
MNTLKILIAPILTIFCFSNLYSQNIEKVSINSSVGNSGYYLVVKPQSGIIKGTLILLPGYGESPESIFQESKLPNAAYESDILVIAISGGNRLYADSSLLIKLNLAFSQVIKNFSVDPEKIVIGGFSAGGTIALRYAELCKEFPKSNPIQPKAVFSIDSPVDLIEIYHYFEREISRNYSQAGVTEAKFALKLMQEEIGSPEFNINLYKKLTPFYKDLPEPGNEKYLQNMSVRVYHDVDINWYLKERRRSALDMNFLFSSELINRLTLIGNTHAEFIQSAKKGVRSSGLHHPHSWNIVEETECIQWIIEQL